MQNNNRNHERAQIREDFIRRLFAVAISVGFASTFSRLRWVEEVRSPSPEEWNHLAVLGVAFWATIQSWDNYLVSIKRRPLFGTARFTIDIVLVLIYMFLLINSKHASILAPTISLIFVLYIAWDFLTIREHYDQFNLVEGSAAACSNIEAFFIYVNGARDAISVYKGPIITFSWAVYFFVAYLIFKVCAQENVAIECFFTTLGLVLYRHDKGWKNGETAGYLMCARVFVIMVIAFLAWDISFLYNECS